MKIIAVSEPIYVALDKSAIRCKVTYDNGTTQSFTATSNDTEPHGAALFLSLRSGAYGAIGAFVPRPPRAPLPSPAPASPAAAPALVDAFIAHIRANPEVANTIIATAQEATSLKPNR